jgi:hypothetical protein
MDSESRSRVIIDGVDTYRLPEPLFEAVRIALDHRGESYSAAYVAGISGSAFRIAGICPCAPTCSSAMMPHELTRRLGYDATHVSLESVGADWQSLVDLAARSEDGLPAEDSLTEPALVRFRVALVDMVERVKDEIRAGRPAVVWHAFTWAENDVVVGFDESTGELFGRGSYAGNGDELAVEPQYRTLTAAQVGGWPSALLIGDKTSEPDLPALEVAALREAVQHGRSEKNIETIGQEDWTFLEGLSAYDQWIEHFGRADKKREMGDAYCYGIYRTTHRAAAGFLREIAPNHPPMDALLLEAAGHFETEADLLDGAVDLLSWSAPEGPDAQRNARVVEALTPARAAYAAGIGAIERALGQ